ncbi:MAG TPA: DUF6544 family protein [Longimicrobiales bacterium]|nr:DUF6544 family protein [Longimicrobiales bacterium]
MNAGTVVLALMIVVAAAISVLLLGSAREAGQLRRTWSALESAGPNRGFDPSMVEGLPEPARRWLLRAIRPGTPLARSATLRMHGTIRLQAGAEPWPMRAEQVLAPPAGFVWKAEVGRGVMRIRGFDSYAAGRGRLRWRLWGLVPVVNQSDADTDRSAAGRLGGEAALVPSVLLPRYGAVWEAVDDSTARFILHVGEEEVASTVTVDDAGRLMRVVIRRWNGDETNGPVGYIPFVVTFEGESHFGGYTTPARLTAGWERDGRPDPFFVAELDDVDYR